MRGRTILGLAASCALAACAHQGPQPMPGMAWSLTETDSEGAKLAYGAPQSDNVLMMLTCRPKSGQVRLSITAPDGAGGALELASQGKRSRLKGEVQPGMMSDGVFVEATATASDPALESFARSGELTVIEGGRRAALPARGAERTAVAGFLAACRAA